jgi:ribosomal protein S18 acetylase RimI-like enzyme
MQENITIRRATSNDIDFLTEAIIAAEKSGTGMQLSYATIFRMREEEAAALIKQAMEEEIEGQELCHLHFLIAEVNGERAATCASWIEAKEGIASGQLKANILFHLVGKEKWENASVELKAVAGTNIERTQGAAQIESVYTRPGFRGRGLTSMIIEEHLKQHRAAHHGLEKAQVILLKNNTSAANAYRKAGFVETAEKTGDDPVLVYLLPCSTKIMMERTI